MMTLRQKVTHPMNRPRDPHVPASAWADTQRVVPKADLAAPATQIVGDREAYLGQGDVGRRIAEDQVELFITGDVAGALQREFQRLETAHIALHDIGSSGSLRLLGSLAGAAGAKVQRLSVRRQGHGLALAVLQFVEVQAADGSLVRAYSTDISADAAARQQMARVLLAHSRLGVLLAGDLPLHAISTALHPLHEQMARGLWPNRELLLVPLAGNATLATQGAQLAADTPVTVQVAPRAAKPRQVWAYIAGTWNRVHGAPGVGRGLPTEIGQAVPQPSVPDAEAQTCPLGLDPLAPAPFPPLPDPVQPSPLATGAATDRGRPKGQGQAGLLQPSQPAGGQVAARFTPASDLPSGFAAPQPAARATAAPAASAQPPMAMPVPGGTRWQDYADRCLGVKGVQSVCVFDTHSLQPLAHAGGMPSGERLAQQGALLLAEMVDVARALGFGATRPDAAITVGAHHLLLQHVPGHPGIALHLVVLASATHLTVARVQLERVEPPR